jgi:hypothetical protein
MTTSSQRSRLLKCIQSPEKGYWYNEKTGEVFNIYGKVLKGIIFLNSVEEEKTNKILENKKRGVATTTPFI